MPVGRSAVGGREAAGCMRTPWLTVLALLVTVPPALCGARRTRSSSGPSWHLPYPLLPYPGKITGEWLAVQQEAGKLFDRVLWMNASVEVTGHIWMYPRQAQYYHHIISELPRGTQMCEAGFGSGLSTLGYLRANPHLKLITFDLWDDTQGRFGFDPIMHQRKVLAEKELLEHFADRWTLVKGNSYATIPAFFEKNRKLRCDVVHVDGNHTRGGVLTDLVFFQPQVAPSHLVLMDDLQYKEIQRALGDFSGGVDDAKCFRTDRRDLRFTGRITSKRNRKNWCHFTFRREWEPDAGFKEHFLSVTGRYIPESMVKMAQESSAAARAAGPQQNKHAAKKEAYGDHEEGGDAAVKVEPAGRRAAHIADPQPPPAAASTALPRPPAQSEALPFSVTALGVVTLVVSAVLVARRHFRPRDHRTAH